MPKSTAKRKPPPPPPPRRVEPEKITAQRVIEWIEEFCFIPEGKFVGKPVRLYDWQKRNIELIYDNPHGTRRAILSFGRKNGKTSFAAMLLLVNLAGPPAKSHPNSQLFSAAQSRDQAALIFNLAAKMVRMNPQLSPFITIRETAKELLCEKLGIRYRALSAEATTAYGLSPVLIIHDELGQVRGPRSSLYEALETATGAQENPMSIIISTQAPTDADLLSVLIDDAVACHDPHTVISLYTAPPDLDPFDEETIKLANPAYGTFLSAKEVTSMAADAKRMPARESEYRNLILNQRVTVSNPFVSPSIWAACGGPVGDLKGHKVYGGLDLSEVSDLTALALIAKIDGKWHVKPTFWLPHDGLDQRSITDRVPYDLWAQQGYLETSPGKTISYEFVANYLIKLFEELNIVKIGFDKWNMRHLHPWLLKAGFREGQISERFVEFGQGIEHMSPALRDLEEVILSGDLVHGNHPVLSMCTANAIVVKDDSGNRKLSKKKSIGRIDGAVALTMALAMAPLKTGVDVDSMLG